MPILMNNVIFYILISIVSVLLNSSQELNLIPNAVVCCQTYNSLTCGIHKNRCNWKVTSQSCEYKEISTLEINFCFNETKFESKSCPNELDDDLSSIPVYDVRDEIIEYANSEFASPSQATIMEITDGVYLAISYDLANTILIETITGLIVIDTLSEANAARQVFNDYKALRLGSRSDDQMHIEAIILTHFHTDHSIGIGFWFDINEKHGYSISPKVYVNEAILEEFERFFVQSLSAIVARAERQFGMVINHELDPEIVQSKHLSLSGSEHLNAASNATFINYKDDNVIMFTEKEYEITVSNIVLKLMKTPGETTDHISIWYEDKKILFIGDNMYYAFPNIYSIRGTTPRDPKKWIESLEKYMTFPAEYVIGSHSLPIVGVDNIQTELQLYRDLIAFVHDQTLRFMAKQWRLNVIVDKIEETLPQKLREGRGQEFYGTVEWSVRAIYDLYLGWFEGDSSQLYPSNIHDRGAGLFKVFTELSKKRSRNDVEGTDMINILIPFLQDILADAEENNAKDDAKYIQVALPDERWILELVTWLADYYGEYKECDEWRKLMDLRWQIMYNMAGRSISMNGRNYLVSQYLEERFNLAISQEYNSLLTELPIEFIMEGLKYKVRPELILIEGRNWRTNIKFKDSGLMFSLQLRSGGVLAIDEYSTQVENIYDIDDDAQLIYEMNEIDFKNGEILDAKHVIKGSLLHILDFWSKFEKSNDESTPIETEQETSNSDHENDDADDDELLALNSLVSINIFDITNLVDYILESILFDKRDFIWIIITNAIFSTIVVLFFYHYTAKTTKKGDSDLVDNVANFHKFKQISV